MWNSHLDWFGLHIYKNDFACKYSSRNGRGEEDELTLTHTREIKLELLARGEDLTLTCRSLMEILWEKLKIHRCQYLFKPKIESTSINLKLHHHSQRWSLIWVMPAQAHLLSQVYAREWNFSCILMLRTLVWACLGVWSGRCAGCSLSSTLNLSLDFWPFTWHCPVIFLVSQILASHLTCELWPFTWPLIS